MKIIDQTPFFKEDGSLSLVDRGRAVMQFGSAWIKEVEAQNEIIAVLGKNLDKKFTLLHNVTPPGLGTMLPLILVGPTGVYVLGINPLAGLFSARGNQWGVIVGGTLKPEKLNLMDRIERMARAVQLYLQRQGYTDLNNVEPVLLCSDPGANVDSVRPIIRVVMRDALERFAVSIAQGRVVLSPESAFDVVERLLHPPKPKPAQTAAPVPESNVAGSIAPEPKETKPENPPSYEVSPPPPAWLDQPGQAPIANAESQPPLADMESEPPVAMPAVETPAPRRRGINRKQWGFLIAMFVIWIIIVAVFAFLIARDFLLR
jgi:hypothetical protein